MSRSKASERTPLLRQHHSYGVDHEQAIAEDEALLPVLSIPNAPGLALEPTERSFTPIYRRGSSSSHWMVTETEEDVAPDAEQTSADPHPESHFLGDYSTRRFWIIYSGVLLQYFVATFDSTLMASSHPVITSYFNASNSASWLSTAFMLTSTAFQPIFGRISDTFGRRPLYLFALYMFALTTAWCAVAQNIGSFIAARAFCGLGAGGVMAMGSIITNDLIKIEYRGTYQAYINVSFGLGSASGAALGGLLCDTLGWRWTFGIQIPPVLIILIAATLTTPKSLGPQLAKRSEKKWYQILGEFDLAGSFLLTCTSAFLILGVNLGGNVLSWRHPLVITSLVLSALTSVILLRVEARAERPVMPLSMIFKAPRGNLVFSNFFSQIGINAVIFNAPLYFQAVKLDSPSVSGLRLGGPSALLTIVAVATGLSITWTGRMKATQVAGAFSMLVGAVCLSLMWDGIPSWLATVFVVPPSLGQGLMFPATTIAVLATSLQADQAIMTTTLTLWRNLGTVLGVAISSGIVQNSLVAYLNEYVTGVDKANIITRVRRSVRSIAELEGQHQREVITAYEAALRMTFISTILFFVIVNVLIIPVKLPRLGKQKAAADADEEQP